MEEKTQEEKVAELTDKQKELAAVWKIAGMYVPCRRCKGTGAIPDDFDEMDYLVSKLSDHSKSDLEWAISRTLDKHTIRKTKRAMFTKVLQSLVEKINEHVPSGFDGTEANRK